MSRRIPDPAGLIAGIAFTGVGLVFLLGEVELANRARWVWPIVLFSLGAGILAAVLRRPADQAAGTNSLTDRSGSPAWPHTEVQPAAQAPSGAEAWPGPASDATPVPGERPEAPAWPRGDSAADAEAATAVEERPSTAPDSVADQGPDADEPAAPGSGPAADDDAVEESRPRQAGGPPA
ncbi:MAG TPA: hypothetical protein VNK73_21550 [Actinomycetota bacterium]|nr:hypothetical protein [Actinomycetota bacterium]